MLLCGRNYNVRRAKRNPLSGSKIPELSAMLSGRIWRTEGKHESGIHYTGNQGRDFKIESGIAIARRQSKAEGDEADENTTPENISGWQETNRSRSAGKMGED
jgi:hypothetical protein